LLALLTALPAGCSRPRHGDFRTTSTPSADRQTLVIVDPTERPGCVIVLDGKPWPAGQPGPVTRGSHAIGCVGDTRPARVMVHEGATVRVDLLGP
jgi:hypothetical protein